MAYFDTISIIKESLYITTSIILPPSSNPQSTTIKPPIIDLGDLFPSDPVPSSTTTASSLDSSQTVDPAQSSSSLSVKSMDLSSGELGSMDLGSVSVNPDLSTPLPSTDAIATDTTTPELTSPDSFSTPTDTTPPADTLTNTISPDSTTSNNSSIMDINLSDLRMPSDTQTPDQQASALLVENPEEFVQTESEEAKSDPTNIPESSQDVSIATDEFPGTPSATSQNDLNPTSSTPVTNSTSSNDDPFTLDIDLSTIQLDDAIPSEFLSAELTPADTTAETTTETATEANSEATTDSSPTISEIVASGANTDTPGSSDSSVSNDSLVSPQTSTPQVTNDTTISNNTTVVANVSNTPNIPTIPDTSAMSNTDTNKPFDISEFAAASIIPTQPTPDLATTPSIPVPSLIASELEHDHAVPGLNSNPFEVGTAPLTPNATPAAGVNIDAMLGSLGTTVEQLQPAPISLITQQPLLLTPQASAPNGQQMRIQAFSLNSVYKIIFILLIAGIGLGAYYSVTNPVEFDLLVSNILGASQDSSSQSVQNLNTTPAVPTDSLPDDSPSDTGADTSIDTTGSTTTGSSNTVENNDIADINTGSTNTGGVTSGSTSSGINSDGTLYTGLDEVLKPGILQDQRNERIAGYLIKVKEVIDTSRLQKNKEAAKQSITLQKSLQQLQQTIKSDTYDAQKINSQLDNVEPTLAEIKALLNDPLNQDEKTL